MREAPPFDKLVEPTKAVRDLMEIPKLICYNCTRDLTNSSADEIAGHMYCGFCSPTVADLTRCTPEEGKKFDQEKPDLSLISSVALLEVARVMTFGKTKYGANNWRGGIKWTRIIAGVLRHCFAWLGGETNDPETRINHLAHACCGLFFLLEFSQTRRDLDDRYRSPSSEAATNEK